MVAKNTLLGRSGWCAKVFGYSKLQANGPVPPVLSASGRWLKECPLFGLCDPQFRSPVPFSYCPYYPWYIYVLQALSLKPIANKRSPSPAFFLLLLYVFFCSIFPVYANVLVIDLPHAFGFSVADLNRLWCLILGHRRFLQAFVLLSNRRRRHPVCYVVDWNDGVHSCSIMAVAVFPCLVKEETRENFEDETAEDDKAEHNKPEHRDRGLGRLFYTLLDLVLRLAATGLLILLELEVRSPLLGCLRHCVCVVWLCEGRRMEMLRLASNAGRDK